MTTKTTTSAKYPGWEIEKVVEGGRASYLMTRATGSYAITVAQSVAGEWIGTIALKSPHLGMLIAPVKPFSGTIAECTAEVAARQASAARIVRTEPWGAEARKLRGDNSRHPGTALGRPRFARTF